MQNSEGYFSRVGHGAIQGSSWVDSNDRLTNRQSNFQISSAHAVVDIAVEIFTFVSTPSPIEQPVFVIYHEEAEFIFQSYCNKQCKEVALKSNHCLVPLTTTRG